ncbi:uncharacterized protein MAM_08044 [Metarhizium album ARSEF 1941]|uniref:Cell wall protein n=1 Tax=Metarhizium album (strain ARSEF 1941) TaxID=1081103 RepID=A0A0B2WKA9_METAS|nr:uncharacterized protein MAM_08044 [Metarhizium album ARSEF 1941]KHN94114.1 hypothetical protein MAM_08044 [Metarhizium album ARSEF 1941]
MKSSLVAVALALLPGTAVAGPAAVRQILAMDNEKEAPGLAKQQTDEIDDFVTSLRKRSPQALDSDGDGIDDVSEEPDATETPTDAQTGDSDPGNPGNDGESVENGGVDPDQAPVDDCPITSSIPSETDNSAVTAPAAGAGDGTGNAPAGATSPTTTTTVTVTAIPTAASAPGRGFLGGGFPGGGILGGSIIPGIL